LPFSESATMDTSGLHRRIWKNYSIRNGGKRCPKVLDLIWRGECRRKLFYLKIKPLTSILSSRMRDGERRNVVTRRYYTVRKCKMARLAGSLSSPKEERAGVRSLTFSEV